MTHTRAMLLAILVGMGAAWGITQPLSKIAVSEGYRDIGIIFWQFAIGAALLGALLVIRRKALPLQPVHLRFYLLIALIGTILPNWASFTAAVHLPSGILSIVIATVPMMALPIAVGLGMDRFSPARIAGLTLGLLAIIAISAPDSSLPDAGMAIWLPIALIAPFLYACEGNIVGRWGTHGLDAMQVLAGASLVGVLISAPLAWVTGEWIDPRGPWGVPDWAILGSSLAHVAAYVTYVWLVGAAGAVFTAQVGYLVTGFGILWAKLILGEIYSTWVWAALALMMVGLFLVTPRPRAAQPAQ
ncbi:DMT family transporter [Gymnodinialimonas ulvae]|uniref:DMT family transporter n=1 Tax=Gymnodinialimonas ulvae TaxID=3126504 RepID=UPI0030AA227F